METLHGKLTWKDVQFQDVFEKTRKQKRVIGLSFPEQNTSLGLEPSILTVLPQGDNVEFSARNKDFPDDDVELYLCSVYISGLVEFEQWAMRHDRKKIVVGGYHPTTFPEDFLRYADKIVQGPCDDIYATITQPGQVVPGIVSHSKLPRRDLYDMGLNQQIIPDKRHEDTVVSINTSIGCPMRCDFCCSPVMANRVFSNPMELVYREAYDLSKYQAKWCFIRDENFTLQKDWRERLQIIHFANPNTKLYLFASANTITDDVARYMANNGVYMICLGLEDPTKEYAKNKKLDEVISILKKYGIYTYLSFIVNPLEIIGKEAAENFYTILGNRIHELKPEMICGNFLMPFRGTGLWDKYYAFVSKEDYRHYDSKTPILVRNELVREKMKFFMFWFQYQYFTSKFYNEQVREFATGDTLHLRFEELLKEFKPLYERVWNKRA